MRERRFRSTQVPAPRQRERDRERERDPASCILHPICTFSNPPPLTPTPYTLLCTCICTHTHTHAHARKHTHTHSHGVHLKALSSRGQNRDVTSRTNARVCLRVDAYVRMCVWMYCAQVKALEDKVAMVRVKYNEAGAYNKDLRNRIDNLRRERVVLKMTPYSGFTQQKMLGH